MNDGNIYLDGIFGVYGNPINDLLCEDSGIDKGEFMSIDMQEHKTAPLAISTASLFDYLAHLLLSIFLNNRDSDDKHDYPHKFIVEREPFNFETIYLVLNDKTERVRLVDLGVKTFLSADAGAGGDADAGADAAN